MWSLDCHRTVAVSCVSLPGLVWLDFFLAALLCKVSCSLVSETGYLRDLSVTFPFECKYFYSRILILYQYWFLLFCFPNSDMQTMHWRYLFYFLYHFLWGSLMIWSIAAVCIDHCNSSSIVQLFAEVATFCECYVPSYIGYSFDLHSLQ